MCDCSWCAMEQGLEVTDSPTICQRHEEEILAQQAQRKEEKKKA